ncbi:uncharacterized protein LOC143367918, partial [Andrena cerasifolii]|uniref:uncharacterized protein LOC143367918 n=1 Tax=Andrena cerasifolii TaxID=2819439 RepID=UPI004037D39C
CPKTTRLLLQCYRERLLSFRNPTIKKKGLWTEIVDIFQKYGNTVTVDILDRKMRNMKKTYRTIKGNNNKTTTGRGRVKWEYFNAFENIFTKDKTINFGPTISSHTPVSNTPNPSSPAPVDANMNLDRNPTCNNTQHTYSPVFTHSSSSLFLPICNFTGNINDLDDPGNSNDNITIRPDISASEAFSDDSIVSPNLTKPSISTYQEGTNVRSKKLYNLRKKQLETEDKRVEAINVLSNRILESNQIQADRNKLLDVLIKHCTNNH